jgi:hypothetical protein
MVYMGRGAARSLQAEEPVSCPVCCAVFPFTQVGRSGRRIQMTPYPTISDDMQRQLAPMHDFVDDLRLRQLAARTYELLGGREGLRAIQERAAPLIDHPGWEERAKIEVTLLRQWDAAQSGGPSAREGARPPEALARPIYPQRRRPEQFWGNCSCRVCCAFCGQRQHGQRA